jgi:hypothetical protein
LKATNWTTQAGMLSSRCFWSSWNYFSTSLAHSRVDPTVECARVQEECVRGSPAELPAYPPFRRGDWWSSGQVRRQLTIHTPRRHFSLFPLANRCGRWEVTILDEILLSQLYIWENKFHCILTWTLTHPSCVQSQKRTGNLSTI